MKKEGYIKIYDAGQLVFVYNKMLNSLFQEINKL